VQGREAKGPPPGPSGRRIDRVLSSDLSERFETKGREKRKRKKERKKRKKRNYREPSSY